MRKPRTDERWDRTDAGLIVPRRPAFPTRRFIGWMGVAKDCCPATQECQYCADITTNDLLIGISGTFNSNVFNDTYTISGSSGDTGGVAWSASFPMYWGGIPTYELYLNMQWLCATSPTMTFTFYLQAAIRSIATHVISARAWYNYEDGAATLFQYATSGDGECVDRYITDHTDELPLGDTYAAGGVTATWSDPATVTIDA